MSNFKNHTETAITYRLRDFSATTMLRQIRIQEYVSSKYFTLYFVALTVFRQFNKNSNQDTRTSWDYQQQIKGLQRQIKVLKEENKALREKNNRLQQKIWELDEATRAKEEYCQCEKYCHVKFSCPTIPPWCVTEETTPSTTPLKS